MIARATAELRKLVPNPGSYVSESDFFEKDWQHASWARTIRACERSRRNTIRMAYSSCTTALAARSGATMVLKGVPRIRI
jgi:hypothetical protein